MARHIPEEWLINGHKSGFWALSCFHQFEHPLLVLKQVSVCWDNACPLHEVAGQFSTPAQVWIMQSGFAVCLNKWTVLL